MNTNELFDEVVIAKEPWKQKRKKKTKGYRVKKNGCNSSAMLWKVTFQCAILEDVYKRQAVNSIV